MSDTWDIWLPCRIQPYQHLLDYAFVHLLAFPVRFAVVSVLPRRFYTAIQVADNVSMLSLLLLFILCGNIILQHAWRLRTI
jgi:hypothetical protein